VGFSDDSDVVVKQLDDENWQVRARLIYQGKHEPFTVPFGQETDFASVPRVFVWFLPRYGRYTKAAILHDYLWREKAANGEMSWIDADALFRRAMRELDVAFLRRWIMWAAVRWGALLKPRGREGWLREAWRVLLVTLLALPIVAPPAVVILAALALFFIVEMIAWVPIRLGAVLKRRVRPTERPKEVNLPKLEWKLS